MNLAIVIDSFDEYSDIWPYFFRIFNKYWTDCKYPLYLVTNNKTYEGANVIKTGDEIDWVTRTKYAIESLDTKYVLLLLEDYFIGKHVDSIEFDKLLSFVNDMDVKYLRLTNVPRSRFSKDNLFELYSDEEYAINLQASIWEKDYLLELLNSVNGNAWDFEVNLLKNAVESSVHVPMKGCYGVKKDPLKIRNGVLKGKWYPMTIIYYKLRNINILCDSRKILPFWQYIRYITMSWLRNHIPYSLRKFLKKIAVKIGVKFVSEY